MAVATAKTLAHTSKLSWSVCSVCWLCPRAGGRFGHSCHDARCNNVYAGFYQSGQSVRPEAHLPLAEVLEIAGVADQPVTFVGETAVFAEQIEAVLPQATPSPTFARRSSCWS